MKEYVLVIDTNKYSGNFERELTAFCTGILGECEVGDKEVIKYNEEETYSFDSIALRADEHNIFRPTSIYKTPSWWNDGHGKRFLEGEENEIVKKYPAYNSVAIFFYKEPTKEEIKIIKRRAEEYVTNGYICFEDFKALEDKNIFCITGYRLITTTTTIEEKELDI